MSTDTQNFLYEATTDYDDFKRLNDQINKQVAEAYEKAGLKPPGTKPIDILQGINVAHSISSDETSVEITKILTDIAGFAGTIKYLTPGLTRALVRAGVITEETAAEALIKFTIPLLRTEVAITKGGFLGGLLGTVVGSAAIAVVDLGIDAIEQSKAAEQLREALHKIYPVRTATKLSLDKAKRLLESIKSVKSTLDALTDKDGKPIVPQDQWDTLLKNLIAKDVQPAVEADQAITVSTVTVELNSLDHSRNSWTVEDIH